MISLKSKTRQLWAAALSAAATMVFTGCNNAASSDEQSVNVITDAKDAVIADAAISYNDAMVFISDDLPGSTPSTPAPQLPKTP